MYKASLLLLAAALPVFCQVKITKGDGRIAVQIDGKPFTDFYTGDLKPYLHPLRAASGTQVTRDYPMSDTTPGEAHDHPHHRGLWFTHGDVNGFDFWANEKSQENGKKGKVVLVKVDEVKSGKKSGDIAATFNWVDPSGKTLLTETRKMTFYSDPKLRIIDFDIALKGVEKSVFGDTKEGTFALRLAAGLEEQQPKGIAAPKRTGKMVSSEGTVGEKQIWGKRASWVDYSGELKGEKLGITIMDYPQNPKHPTYWHARAYGLFAANIFGERDFYNDKSRDGSMTLEPGQTWRFRYRVVIHPGDAASLDLAKMYKDYAGK